MRRQTARYISRRDFGHGNYRYRSGNGASNHCAAFILPDAAKPRADYILPARRRAGTRLVELAAEVSVREGADALHQPAYRTACTPRRAEDSDAHPG